VTRRTGLARATHGERPVQALTLPQVRRGTMESQMQKAPPSR
jgi:hypothetical protein